MQQKARKAQPRDIRSDQPISPPSFDRIFASHSPMLPFSLPPFLSHLAHSFTFLPLITHSAIPAFCIYFSLWIRSSLKLCVSFSLWIKTSLKSHAQSRHISSRNHIKPNWRTLTRIRIWRTPYPLLDLFSSNFLDSLVFHFFFVYARKISICTAPGNLASLSSSSRQCPFFLPCDEMLILWCASSFFYQIEPHAWDPHSPTPWCSASRSCINWKLMS